MSTSTVVRVDPKTLLVGPNVRKEVTLRKEFVASIQEHGVIVPILAQQTSDGLEVVDGQMRTLAAVDAGLVEVPVYVQDQVVDDASRIVEQIVVNEDRANLTAPDHVAAIAQLALDFKMPAAEIAKRTGATKDQVAHILSASKSPHAAAAIGQEGVTLELAAKIADAGLSKADTQRVLEARWNKDHALQQVLDERDRVTKTKTMEKDIKAAGVTLAAKPTAGEYGLAADKKNKHAYLSDLVDKVTGKPITTAAHAACPGHAAWVGVRGYSRDVDVHLLCTDPAKHGHRDKNRAVPQKLSAADRAQKQLDKERAAEWMSITTVRLTWIREQLLTRRGAPAGWEYLAVADLTEEYTRTWGYWQDTACELLQLQKDEGWNGATTALRAHARKTTANVVKVAIASYIARHEYSIAERKANGHKVISPIYLRLLDTWGYGLSELERSLVHAAAVTA